MTYLAIAALWLLAIGVVVVAFGAIAGGGRG